MLPFVLLVVIIFAPIIYFTDRGPVFYNAERMGKDGRIYKMFKLRSMYMNAPDIRNADGSTFNADKDPRVTPIGHFIRKTSLDEFPQKRVSVKPGVSGYAQAYFRNSISQDEKFRWDAYYADHISLWMDIKVLLMTVRSVLWRENINN